MSAPNRHRVIPHKLRKVSPTFKVGEIWISVVGVQLDLVVPEPNVVLRTGEAANCQVLAKRTTRVLKGTVVGVQLSILGFDWVPSDIARLIDVAILIRVLQHCVDEGRI